MYLRHHEKLRAVLVALPALWLFGLAGCENKDRSGKPANAPTQVAVPADATAASASSPVPPPAASPAGSIRRERVFEPIILSAPKTDPEWEPYRIYIEVFKINTLAHGKYQGGELLLVRVQHLEDGPCKGAACDKPHYQHLRYVRLGKQMIFLPRISKRLAPGNNQPGSDKPQFLGKNPFEKFGLSLVTDADFTLPSYEYPESIRGGAPGQVLELEDEEEGELDEMRLVKFMQHPVFGGVYTSRPERGPANTAYSVAYEPTVTSENCYGASCFDTNAFFVFRPDGTLLKYRYSKFDLIVDGYTFATKIDCAGTSLDELAVVAPAIVRDTDLIDVKKTQRGPPIFRLKDANHKLVHEFYAFYQKNPHYDEHGEQTAVRLAFADFQAAQPILFTRDAFGRLVRLTKTEFLPALGCEPIIYLYPEKTQTIRIAVKPRGGVQYSTPAHQEAWQVIADPQGRIRNAQDGKTYPYLFWEGALGILPQPERGFVVEKSQVAEFFRRVLPRMGLNDIETTDFMAAWLPEFTQAPFYFITFFERAAIDAIAPLEISPPPDTVIRILMDYRPLPAPIAVAPLKLVAPPARRGFTLIEWGGVKR